MITVIASYRSGSSAFCQKLSELTGYKYNQDTLTGETIHTYFKEYPEARFTNPKQIHKIIPDQIKHWEDRGYFPVLDYIEPATRFYLIRENITEQIISWVRAQNSKAFHPFQDNWQVEVEEPVRVRQLENTEKMYAEILQRQSELYYRYPGVLVKYENIFSKETRYKRPDVEVPNWTSKLKIKNYFPGT